jgi:hypothetical protein
VSPRTWQEPVKREESSVAKIGEKRQARVGAGAPSETSFDRGALNCSGSFAG